MSASRAMSRIEVPWNPFVAKRCRLACRMSSLRSRRTGCDSLMGSLVLRLRAVAAPGTIVYLAQQILSRFPHCLAPVVVVGLRYQVVASVVELDHDMVLRSAAAVRDPDVG